MLRGDMPGKSERLHGEQDYCQRDYTLPDSVVRKKSGKLRRSWVFALRVAGFRANLDLTLALKEPRARDPALRFRRRFASRASRDCRRFEKSPVVSLAARWTQFDLRSVMCELSK